MVKSNNKIQHANCICKYSDIKLNSAIFWKCKCQDLGKNINKKIPFSIDFVNLVELKGKGK